ncbi:MAG: sigma 54-interacting transcriptional regulator [Gammaproteobacteria bacterium]|nr:sigma 54-interacting transcriptional regulator [Gammaproteobacteria bacterium]
MSAGRVLLVDDDPDLLHLLSLRLSAAGYETDRAQSGEEAMNRLEVQRPQVVITDLRMGGMDGMALFAAIRRRTPSLPVIILTAHGTIPEAVEAIRQGAFAFLTKPFDGGELLTRVREAVGQSETWQPHGEGDWRADILSRSPLMDELLSQAKMAAASQASILIHGESGTGKELVARAIHRASSRRAYQFVPINCAAIPEALLESELFGHVKGAFTGATQDHPGLFRAAHGGTLFLDEIADMPLNLQVKLLRVLQDHEVRPVGALRAQPTNVRIVCATHRNLEAEVQAGRFREDLYYRISVVCLEIPPLSQRPEDISLLAKRFLARLVDSGDRSVRGFAPAAMEVLVAARWPGNVRQLVNVVEQCYVLSTTSLIEPELVQRALRAASHRVPPLAEARSQFERQYLVQLLKMTAGNTTQAARLAGRNRTEFYRLLRRYGLDPGQFRENSPAGADPLI